MKSTGVLKSAALAAAGAALFGGGMFLGLMSALMRRNLEDAAPEDRSTAPGLSPGPDPAGTRRLDELARAVADLQKRVDAAPAPGAVAQTLDAVSLRVEQLERRVEQMAAEPALPAIDQILGAVEQMVSQKVAGLDERLTDQLHAIELLRNASNQTDSLLQKLIQAVETLADQTAERVQAAEEPETEPGARRDYPIA